MRFYQRNFQYISGACSNVERNLYNSPQPKIENLISSEYNNRTPNFDQIRIKQLNVTLRQDLISMTSELNNGIKELNSEIKRLYSVLTRFDQVNRGKRGVNEQTAIVDCVQMKGNFKKIFDDLNRISKTLSMVDENGTYHCKCPTDIVMGTSTEIADLPLELTTFSLENINRTSSSGEKTKQLKKVILSDYKPQVITGNVGITNNNELRNVANKDTIGTETTVDEDNRFTTVQVLEDNITTQKETDMVTEPREDMSPDMSNAVTNLLNLNGYTQTAKLQTSYNEIVTKDYKDVQTLSSETPKTMTDSTTIPDETIAITAFDYDDTYSTEEELISDKKVSSKLTGDEEDILRSTIEISDLNQNESNNITKTNSESTIPIDYILESITEVSELDKNKNNNDVTKTNVESTTLNDMRFKSITEISSFDNNENKYTVTKNSFELTTVDDTGSELTTKTSDLNTNANHVGLHFELTSAKQNIKEFTTQISISNQSDKTIGLKERTFTEDEDRIDFGKPNDEKIIIQPKTERTLVENKNDLKPNGYDNKSTPHSAETTQQVQPNWYPICFYPVPCSPNVLSHQQNTQNINQGTIQYSAQSLNTYKRIAPVVSDAMVIQNNYPIISYCPVGMVCPMTDFAGQANILHCMLKSSLPETQLVHVNNKTDENASNRITKSNVDDVEIPTTITGKNARDGEEILTGKTLTNRNMS